MHISDHHLNQAARQVAQVLTARQLSLATAESCTGGWIAKCCTDLAGSSGWFERGFVTYSNRAKRELLGVERELLATHGAVSAATAEAMASGARQAAPVDVALSVTGIAGPDGGTEEKPVGTVWFGWAGPDTVVTRLHRFSGDRDAIRRQAVISAFSGLLDILGAAK